MVKNMSRLAGTRITPAEKLKRIKGSLKKCMRDLEREHTRMEQDERKLIQQIKRAAQSGNKEDPKHTAKDLIRVRSYGGRIPFIKSKIQSVLLQIQDMKPGDDITGVVRSTVDINKQLTLPDIQDIIMEYKEKYVILEEDEQIDDFDDYVDNGDEDEPLKFLGVFFPTDIIPGQLPEAGKQQLSEDPISDAELKVRLECLKLK